MSELSGSRSHPRHPGHIRSDASAATGLAAKRRRNAIGLVAGIIALGLVGLCLRIVPTVLTNAKLIAEIGVPITSIPAAVSSSAAPATATPSPSATRYDPVQAGNGPGRKLHAKPKARISMSSAHLPPRVGTRLPSGSCQSSGPAPGTCGSPGATLGRDGAEGG
jgi:hypothetical protein